MTNENSKVDINKHEIDIETLKKQNVNDLLSIKELYYKLKEEDEKILQIKYIDTSLAHKLKKEYEKLKSVILDENVQAKLYNDIVSIETLLNEKTSQINSQLDIKESQIDAINSHLDKKTNQIETINLQLNRKASQTDLEAQKARIDNFTSLAEGSTTGDAELIDARIGIDGTTYNNAGTAIREQIKKRTAFVNEVEQYLKEENRRNGYYYNRNATNENGYTSGNSTSIYPKIPIRKGVTYHYKNIYAYFSIVIYEDNTRFILSDTTNTRVSGSFKAEKNGYILITTNNIASGISAMFSNGKIIWDNYSEKSYYLSKNLKVDYNNIDNIPNFVETSEFNNKTNDFSLSISNIENKLGFCTDRVTQYLKEKNRRNGYYYHRDAPDENKIVSGNGNSIYPKIAIRKGVTYHYKNLYAYFCRVIYNNGTKINLSDTTNTRVSGSFTAEDNGYALITTSNNAAGISAMFADGEIKWSNYTEGSYQSSNGLTIPYKDIIDIPNQNINLHVKKDGNGDFTSLVDCIKSITDSSLKKQYNIYLYDDHDIIKELGGQNYIESLPETADRTSLYIPEYVNIIGVGLRVISGKIERTWNCNYNAIEAMSTLEIKKGNNKFKNLIITAQNMRYAVHDESNGSVPNNSVEWENCKFIHYGNDDFKDDNTGQWLSVCGYGSGISSGCIRKFNQCYFESNAFFPFSCHDNRYFKYGAYLYFNDCEFYNKGGNIKYSESAKLSTYGPGTVDNTAAFNNCILKNILVKNEISSENLNRWRGKTCGNVTDYIAKSDKTVPHVINI